jgi:hypothetical protein
MRLEDVHAALTAATSWGQPVQVHFTGGEPFLNFHLLQRAVMCGVSLGIPCYVETNAAWCVNENITGRQFENLQKAGLRAVLISCSPFHAETIPLERILLAVRKAYEIFGFEGVIVHLPEWIEILKPLDRSKPIPLAYFYSLYGREDAGRLFWEGYGLIAGGRSGYRLGNLIPRQPPESFAELTCRSELLYSAHSHFDLYGNFIPGFCGGISVGSWRELPRTVANFVKGIFPELIGILMENGPFGLYEYARRHHHYSSLDLGYAGKCHLCVDVRRHLASKKMFPELDPLEFYQRI